MFFPIIFYSFMFAGEFSGAITTSFMRPLIPRTNENDISLHIMSNLGYNTPNHLSSFANVVACARGSKMPDRPPDAACRRQMVQATASPQFHREGASMHDSPPTLPQQVEDVKNTGTGVGIPEWRREVLGARLSFSSLSPSLLFSCGDVWA